MITPVISMQFEGHACASAGDERLYCNLRLFAHERLVIKTDFGIVT